MYFLHLFYICGVFFAEYATGDENPLKQMLQEKISCFMVNTAAKIYRLNIENKMHDKNIIFSPMDLYASTALVYLGTTDIRIKHQLHNILGIQTLEKFTELNPEYASVFRPQKTKKNLLTNLAYNNEEFYSNEDLDYQNYYDLVNKELGNLFRNSLRAEDAAIRSGRAIFVDKKYVVKKNFVEMAKKYYDTGVKRMNFKAKPKQSTDTLNNFVKNQTYDRITNFFDKPLEKMTKSVLSSSLTLVTNWRKIFQPNDTYETAFHTRDGECDDCNDVDICVMLNQGNIPYYADSTVTAIALPTATNKIRMYYVVPRNNQTLSELIGRPNKNFFKKVIDGVKSKRIIYQVPKMNFGGELNQLDILRMYGLDKITLDSVATRLTLSIFKQKVLLEVNEEGIGGCPLQRSKKMPLVYKRLYTAAVQFIADKPFLFFIYDSRTKMFLFYGAVFKPTGYTDF